MSDTGDGEKGHDSDAPNGGHARAGMEDSVFMYPHRDDLIKSSAEVVTKVRRISEEVGREIATPKEARAILGLGKQG